MIELGKLGDARAVYLRAADILPDHAIIHERLGELELERGNEEDALVAFTRATELNSDDMETYLTLGVLQSDSGQTRDALNTMTLALQREFSSAQSSDYTRLGIALFDLGAVKKSNAAYNRAVVLGRQKHVIAQFNLGLAYLAMGDVAAANATYAAAIAEFGAEEAERIGADSDLRELARNSKHAENAHELLRKYWPKKP